MRCVLVLCILLFAFPVLSKGRCKIHAIGNQSQKASVQKALRKNLEVKGYDLSGTDLESHFLLDIFLFCFDDKGVCASVVKFESKQKGEDYSLNTRSMHNPAFGDASMIKALENSLKKIPECLAI